MVGSSRARKALQAHRDEVVALAAAYQLSDIRVFGSIARGADDDDGDIDLLVVMPPGGSLLSLGGFLMDVRDLVGVPVDVATTQMLKPHVRAQVLREALPL